ncbi:CPBP family intramembrane glutamic endopeptidase [Hymenobacter sediminis]|uniref:CPBP family intramembrane glutamic endopeptidase n=1 Tax=Hymenobacter sediminis TaxID=2218621 RepID=UPI00138FBEC7|nr:CPBP family intramembrane glutamic endopeptidase [Hymenobacter sediminis]
MLLIYGLHWTTPTEAGLQRMLPKSGRVVVPVVLLVAAGLFIDAVVSRYGFRLLTTGEKLYYVLMPGLEEELFYRGVLLGILSRVFPKVVPLPGTYTSWGGVVGVALFILGHGLKFPVRLFELGHGMELWQYVGAWVSPTHFPLHTVVYHFAMGSLLLWVRERTNSCWVAVGAHCLLNSCLVVGHAWV